MSDTSLLERAWASAQAALGTTTRVEVGPVDPRELGRFGIAATGSMADPSGSDLCDPLFLSSVLAWGTGPAEPDLLPDGNAADPFGGVDVGGLRLMGGGQDLVFHRDVPRDVPIVLEVTIADARLTEARSGRLLLLTVERRYSDVDGLLVECRETFLGREEVA